MFRDDGSGSDGIAAILPFILEGTRGLVMPLVGYFDESVRQDGLEPICVAGYLFKPTSYKQFVRRWKFILKTARPGGIDHLHMTDLVAGRREFEGRTISQRRDVLRQAIALINDTTFGGVGCLFNQAEFERAAPAHWVMRFGSIYSCACQITLQVSGNWLRKRRVADRVAYVFESGHKFQAEANALFSGLCQHQDYKDEFRYHSHTFIDKRRACGLQAADLLAWAFTKAYVRVERDEPLTGSIRAFAPELLGLIEAGDRMHIAALTGEKLKQFIDEQLNPSGDVVVVSAGPRKKALR